MSCRCASSKKAGLVTLGLAVYVRLCVAAVPPYSICPDAIDSFNKLRGYSGLKPLEIDQSLGDRAGEIAVQGVRIIASDISICTLTSEEELVSQLRQRGILWRCAKQECKNGPTKGCKAAVHQWSSYKWVDSDTPLDDNPKGLDYAQILWPSATMAGCAVSPSMSNQGITRAANVQCRLVVCLFDKGVVRTNAALKETINPLPKKQPEPEPDKYSWCSSCIVSNQKLCNDEQLQCNGGPIADCCPTSCAATSG